uniref:Rabankyrin-5 n=1 Tax=Petromyzon marinus TaxID=7757 RepID=A0AAJ7X6J2_PETMA|nr:rabankyrin-5 [Petromyzon marinus]
MAAAAADGEDVAKLQKHLALLRQEYVKLQQKLTETERRCAHLAAASGQDERADDFISRLLAFVADLYRSELYSDLQVKLKEQAMPGHKFVFAARSDLWSMSSMASSDTLDLSGIDEEVAVAMLRWVYTEDVDTAGKGEAFLTELMKLGSQYKLTPLRERSEKAIMSSVTVRNCIRYYQTAEELGATSLLNYCAEIIASHWDDLRAEDFSSITAPLLYKMFKSKTDFPLHQAIKAEREDVVFLYLIEYDSQLPDKLDEADLAGKLPLELALERRLESIATTLVTHRADVERPNSEGCTLLHRAITRGDEFSAAFLIRHGAFANAATVLGQETPLHLVSSRSAHEASGPGTVLIANALLEAGANPNTQDSSGRTPLHRAIVAENEAVFSLLLQCKQIDLELRNRDGDTALWLALRCPVAEEPGWPEGQAGQHVLNGDAFSSQCLAARLIARGSNADASDIKTGNSLLQRAAAAGSESATLFLVAHGASINHTNSRGETPLHTACHFGLAQLTAELLHRGANPNAQTGPAYAPSQSQTPSLMPVMDRECGQAEGETLSDAAAVKGPGSDDEMHAQTPLHLAIYHNHPEVVAVFLEQKANALNGVNNLQIIPDFSLKDSKEQTVLGLALWTGMHKIAAQLLGSGAAINERSSDGQTLLHAAILKRNSDGALFLLEHNADINIRTAEGQTPLQLAIRQQLPLVVDALCTRGADMTVRDPAGDPPLWVALQGGNDDIASTLVRHGCDSTCWGPGPGGCQQTLLHRAIDENNEKIACFLIRSDCDRDGPRRPGLKGEGQEEARDGQTPLHLAATWGLEEVVQCLLEYRANVNMQDAEGRTPLHIAISNQHDVIIALLLSHPELRLGARDRQGQTPFACAMTYKNNRAADAILKREPTAAEQVDNKGRNFLHVAVQNSDIESVLFLISVSANVNSRVQDSTGLTPLHLATQGGSEIIVRNLLLAGANVRELTKNRQTALHLAAQLDLPSICSVLIENSTDFSACDDNGNNALHLAVMHGRLNVVRVLLTESSIDAEAFNLRGQSPMHVLGQYGKENAAAIFELFLECMPEYPLDKPDIEGHTVLLLAYMKGNGNLCRAVVRAGARLGLTNSQGVNIFNYQVATKQLLFRLLDMLSKEPPWCDGSNCYECAAKFGVTTRKHHCRHCGRLLCNRCSAKEIPIIKFDLNKPVRVCDICFDVLTLGGVS